MWDKCLKVLEDSLPQDQFNTWISPLQALENTDALILFVPNQMMLERIKTQHLDQIKTIIKKLFVSIFSCVNLFLFDMLPLYFFNLFLVS